MREIEIGGVKLGTQPQDTEDPYIIGMFGSEGTGKTRFALTGPELSAMVPLERKSYFTIEQYERETGKHILRPKDPETMILNMRKALALESDCRAAKGDAQKDTANRTVRAYYRDHVNRIKDVVFGLLEHPDVRLLTIDTFGQLCMMVDSAIYGTEEKFIKVEGKVYKDRKDYNQEIIDFLNALSSARKTVILIHKAKDEYGRGGPTGRQTFEGFKFLGHHTNVILEFEANKKWNPSSDAAANQWHWAVNVRTCQRNPMLEAADVNPIMVDEAISYAGLIMAIDPEANPDELM